MDWSVFYAGISKLCAMPFDTTLRQKNLTKRIMIDINNRQEISQKLNLLRIDTLPLFGKM